MTRIRCHYEECYYLEDGFCVSKAVEVDPDVGCLTFRSADDIRTPLEDDDVEEESLEDWELEELEGIDDLLDDDSP